MAVLAVVLLVCYEWQCNRCVDFTIGRKRQNPQFSHFFPRPIKTETKHNFNLEKKRRQGIGYAQSVFGVR